MSSGNPYGGSRVLVPELNQLARGRRMKLRTLLLLVSLYPAVSAQTVLQFSSANTLQPGAAVEREIGPGQVHHFNINLQENQFVQLVVDQSEIDVIVKVSSPSGKNLGEFDLSNGDDGPEHVSFVAATTGKYHITVGPLEQEDSTVGRYQIKVVEIRKATDQELKTHKSVEVTKAKGVALLAEIEGAIPQIKSDHTRMKVQIQAAQLLWDIDEKRSLKLFTDATASFQAYVESIDPDHLQQFNHLISQLRHEMIHALAARDPEVALTFLHSTSQMVAAAFEERDHFNRESALELAIADQIGRKNPKRAFEMARQILKQGYSTSLINTLSELRQKNPELGAELAKEIAGKVLNEKLLKRSEAGYVAAGLLRSIPAAELSHQSTKGTPPPPLLPEASVRELVQKAFDEALSYSPPARESYDQARDVVWHLLTALTAVATRLDTITPGGSAAVNKKLQEIGAGGNYGNAANDSAELSLEAIGKMPVEQRQQQYIQLAYNEGNKGQFTLARQIVNDRVTNRYQRRQTLFQIDRQEMHRALNHGKADDVIRLLSGFTNSQERAQQLSQIANQIGPGLKRATALRILEQARNMLSSSVHAEGQDHMHALLELARAFSRYDVKRSFEIVDPLIEQFNEMVEAASKLNGFGFYYLDGEELDLQNSNPVAQVSSQISSVLSKLALVNFERAKATTDRISTPGVRLRVYLEIAQQTIDAAK